jgi:quinol monooxygenase YgiN
VFATMRQYAGIAPAAFETLMSRRADVEAVIRQTPGFLQYDLVRTQDGMASFTVCTDQAGADASNRQVAAWIAKNLPALATSAPTITAGEAVLHFAAK